MEEYNYNYQQIQIPKNYPIYENSINKIQTKYINYTNIPFHNHANFQIESYSKEQSESNFSNNIYNIQTSNITNLNYPSENYYINNEQIINKIPKDTNFNEVKSPKDNIKRKNNLVYKNSLKKNNNNLNKINIIHNYSEEYKVNNIADNKEKQPKDNYKNYSSYYDLKSVNNKENYINKINDKITKVDIDNQNNYLKTNDNNIYEYYPKKASKRNSIKTIERMKKNNLISISDVLPIKKQKTQTKPKETNKKTNNKTKNKIVMTKLDINLNKNYSTNKINNKPDSNFASLINQKKFKMFSSYKLVPNNNPINTNNNNNKNKPDKVKYNKRPPKSIQTIGIKKNFGRLYSPQLTSPNQRIKKDNQIEIKKTKEILNRKNVVSNINIELKKNVILHAETNIKNKLIKSYIINSNKQDRASSYKKFLDKSSNLSENKRKMINASYRNIINKKENNENYDLMDNYIQKAYNKKTMNANKYKNNSKRNNNLIIKKHLSLKSKNTKSDDNNKTLNKNSTKIRKKIIFQRAEVNSDKKEITANQKKNLFSFSKKTHRKNSHNSEYTMNTEKNEIHNSYKRFSSIKKLQQIKNKYKFYPHNKVFNKLLKESYIDYAEESNRYIKLINSMYLKKPLEMKNLNLTEFMPQKDINKSKEYYESKDSIKNDTENKIKIMENGEEKDEENKEDKVGNTQEKENDNDKDDNEDKNESDILNHKSFILDLNNVIPINEKQLRDTFNGEQLMVLSTNVQKVA